jgi:tRNA U34 2-thiouridine synthase MnmA/TrmU
MVAAYNTAGVRIALAEPVRAITPGQSAALYDDGGRLLGGGVIGESVR